MSSWRAHAGLHAPKTYIAALVQSACRRQGWPLDASTLLTRVTRLTDASLVTQRAPGHGCYVSGLYLEGAAWDSERQQLANQPPKVMAGCS
jgi:dynein heavy chain, axonemal